MDEFFQKNARSAFSLAGENRAAAEVTLLLLVILSLLPLSRPAIALESQVRFSQHVAHAQALKSDDDGAPTSIVQDSNGLLWVGKTNGLLRYDGIDRDYYRVADYPGLHSNFVRRLSVDSAGRLIVLTDSGVSALVDNELNKLALFPAGEHMNTMLETPDGETIFGGNAGLYNITDGKFKLFLPELEGSTIQAMQWFDDALWIGGVGRLWSLRDGVLRDHLVPDSLATHAIRSLEIYQSQLWLGTDMGIWTLANDSLEPLTKLDQATKIDTLLSDRHGALWFGGTDVAGRLLSDGRIELFDFDGDERGNRALVRAFLEDKDGNFWIARESGSVVGTSSTSVIRLSVSEGLPVAQVNAISTTANGTLLLGHDLGVSIANQREATTLLDANTHNTSAGVNALLHSSEQQVWVGTNSGLAVFADDAAEITPKQLQGEINDPVLVLLEQKPGLIWIGTSNDLYGWENDHLTSAPALRDQRIETIHAAPDGRLWVGTNDGVYFRRNNEFVQVSDPIVPARATVTSITSLPDGNIAAAISDRGILIGRDSKWRLLSESHGFPVDTPFFLGVAPDGYLWGATSSGVIRVAATMLTDPRVDEFSVTTILSTRSTYRPEIDVGCCTGDNASAAAIHENMLYVTGNDGGVLLVDTRSPREELAAPVPYLQSTSQVLNGGWSDIEDGIELPADNQFLRVRYSAVQLMKGSNVRFRYRLGGVDSSWSDVGRDTTVTLSNLAPGRQSFELQASIRDGEWSDSSARFSITRQPRFVETNYFYAAIGIGLVIGYAIIFWVRSHWLRHRVSHIEGLIRQRTADLQNVNDNLNQANEKLTTASYTDALTGLHNRRYLETHDELLGLTGAHISDQNYCTAIVLLDIDLFKRINDEHSHSAGDAVLQQFSDLLKSFVRTGDEVIRWGGEEFLMLMRYREGQLAHILERICQSVRNHSFRSDTGENLKITVSIGVIACPTETLSEYTLRFDDLFQCADMALYSVKRNGRDGWAGTYADDLRFREAARSRQMAEDMLDLVEANLLDWDASRPEFRLDADNSVVQLALVRQLKETQH